MDNILDPSWNKFEPSMKSKLRLLFILLMLAAGVHPVWGQGMQFFRISGPAATTIGAFRSDGTLVWTNAQPGTNYIVQTVAAVPGGTDWVDYVQLPVTNTINTNQIVSFDPPAGMVFIPAGSFTMGDTLDGDTNAVPTNVYVSSFYMDTNLVSYGEWQAVYDWATTNGYAFDDAGSGKGTNYPVSEINWYDAVKWANARSQLAGLTPVYYTDTNLTQVYTNGDVAPYVNRAATGYRLPTEAEWEKAARGGLIGLRFPWGNTISESQANYYGDTADYSYDLGPDGFNSTYGTGELPYTSPVGTYAPNDYGLYDMAGNVFEWCWDWYKPFYLGGSNPTGPASGMYRVIRGGDWLNYAVSARCANRNFYLPTAAIYVDVGLRCVRSLPTQTIFPKL
jgi:formylglycine-generating enzyme